MLPATVDRVVVNTCHHVNERIRRETDDRVARLSYAGRAALDNRLNELNEEWDIERFLETMAPTLTLVGLGLGATVNRKWLIVPAVIQSFFLQHALQGWCPPLPVLRRLGVRTTDEINEERMAIKALRGDFKRAATSPSLRSSVQPVMDAARS